MELNKIMNKVFIGIEKNLDVIKEIIVLSEDKKFLSRFKYKETDAIKYAEELSKLCKNKEVVTFNTDLSSIYFNIFAKIYTQKKPSEVKNIKTFLESHIINFFSNYDFLTNSNNIVEIQHTKSIRAVLDVFSKIFDIQVSPIDKEPLHQSFAYFEAYYLAELYDILYNIQKSEVLPFKK